MRGDDKRRFCEHCQKFVHNISAMSRAEREVFAHPENLRECVLYSRRANGDIADISFLASLRRWLPFIRLASWSTLASLIASMSSGCVRVVGTRCPLPARELPPANNQTGGSESQR